MTDHAQAALTAKVLFSGIAGGISWLLLYTGINGEVFSILAALLVVDFITGVAKAHRLGKHITSNRARYGVASKLSLLLIPLVLGAAARAMGKDGGTLFTWGMNLLILSETYSIIGNIYTIRTVNELPEWDVVSLLGQKIRDMIQRGDNA